MTTTPRPTTATDAMHAGDVFATSVADERDAEGAHVFNAAGGDWDDLVDEAAALHEERIVVNMGPQHPSTHGVLRLILELDGETVTETRAGHRLPAHRHREEHGVPHLDAGRDVLHPDGLPHADVQRGRLLPRRREAARHHRPDPRAGQRHPRAA